MRYLSRCLSFWVVIWLLAGTLVQGEVTEQTATIGRIRIQGVIGPATADYIRRAVQVAAAENHQCLVVELDTPGGLLTSTEDIVQSFYESEIPTVVYVGPSGAKAGSAGCFITLAAHIAAMAPNTSIGAAHPVSSGGEMDDVMKDKMASFAASFIESIAEKRGRNAEWAITSVRESASITSEKALELNVIDFIASDLQSLLEEIDGREVENYTLKTASASVVDIPMLPRERVFQMLWRPEVMMILMMVAMYGIIGELSNPGAIVPGVIGIIALVLALYMGSILPINLAGVVLIIIAIALFIGEIFTPTFGFLSISGAVAFFLGLLMLFDRADPAFRIPLKWIIPATILTTAFFVFVAVLGFKAQFRKAQTGREAMIGLRAVALTPIHSRPGQVFVQGENWRAVSADSIAKDDPVEVMAIDGLTLTVRKVERS